MNLNDFVVLPHNKAKSVKLNARNLQGLQMKTVTLAQESEEIEKKLQQLKESMSKEKEERGHSGGLRWKYGQCGSLHPNALTNNSTKNKDRLQKLSAGKLKIRVLKDEPLTVPAQPPPPPPPPATSLQTTPRNRLRGTHCGQCEVKKAGLMCAECSEYYCIGCFTTFHQKGALKLHRMISIQAALETHVSTQDVVSCFQKINPSFDPDTFTRPHPSLKMKPNPDRTFNAFSKGGEQSPEKGTVAVVDTLQLRPDPSQVMAVNEGGKIRMEMIEGGSKREDEKEVSVSLLQGQYNEEESARSFQEALRQWRGEKTVGSGETMSEEAMWTPVRPVSVSAMATQADLAPDRRAEGRGGEVGEGRVPVRVEFPESSLTYMDRLLLKKRRRTPIETYHPLLVTGTDSKSLPITDTEEDISKSPTVQEEDFHRYCASLFAVPVSGGRTEPEISTPELCLAIKVLDETDRDGAFVAEQKTENNRKGPAVEQILSKGNAPLLQTAESSIVSRSSPSPSHPPGLARAQAQTKAAQKFHVSTPQTSLAEHRTVKSLSSKSKPSAHPVDETPRTSKTSIRTPTLMSQKPNCSPTVHKSQSDRGPPTLLCSPSLPRSRNEIFKSSHSPVSLSPLDGIRPPIPGGRLSSSPSIPPSLRSTFTISPSSSTSESTLLPRVCQSPTLLKHSDSPMSPEQNQSPQLLPELVSSVKRSRSTPCNLALPKPTSLEPCSPVRTPSSISESTPDANSTNCSVATNEDSHFMSSTPISYDQDLTITRQDAQLVPSHLPSAIHNPPLAVGMEEEEDLSIDSGDEMSSDSLGLVPVDENSSDEETELDRDQDASLRSAKEEKEIPATLHQHDSMVPQTDEQEHLPEPSMVMHKQRAGSGSEQLCDLGGFPPLGLDINSGHSDTPGHRHSDFLQESQPSPHYPDTTGSEGFGQDSSDIAQEHPLMRMTKGIHMQANEIQVHSTTPTRRGDVSANKRGTSGSGSPSLPHPPSPHLSSRRSPSTFSPELVEFRPLSQAAQEIMEICSVDQTGCEDPDLDTDTTINTLHSLEEEFRLIAEGTEKQGSVFEMGNNVGQDQHGNHQCTQARVTEEQKEEEAAEQRDRQSVLLLP